MTDKQNAATRRETPLLAALDMDGTLLNTAHETTLRTRHTLTRAAEAGRYVALCTGRCMSELWRHLRDLPGVSYVIAENGGCVYDVRAGRALWQATLPEALSRRILALTDGMDVCRQGFVDNQSYIERIEAGELERYHVADFAAVFQAGSIRVDDLRAFVMARGGAAEKINLYFADSAGRDDFRRRLGECGLHLADSLGVGYEISPPEATKAEGLRWLCDYLGVPVARSMAVGDGGNDLELMRAAGFSVAMGNALPEVRDIADAVTEDCDHDGCALALERWLLGETE